MVMAKDTMVVDDVVLTDTLGAREAPAPMDEQSFHACYRRTAGPLRAYVARVLGNAAHADDIVQETYLRFLRKAPETDGPAAQRALLIRIASNLMIDHRRRQRREQRDASEAPAVAHAAAPNIPLRMDMARVFGTLRPEQRQLMWLAYVEGASHREIGAALGVRERSVRVLLHRARRKLARLLRESGFGRPPSRGFGAPGGDK